MKKEELIETAKALGLEVPVDATVAQLRAMIEIANDMKGRDPGKKPEEPGPPDFKVPDLSDLSEQVKRHRVNRGSSRRMVRAMTNFDQAFTAFAEEMDRQVYVVEGDKRTREWPTLTALREVMKQVRGEVSQIVQGK